MCRLTTALEFDTWHKVAVCVTLKRQFFFSQNHFSIDRAGALQLLTCNLQPATCKLHPPLSYSFLIDMLHIALTQVDLKSFLASGAVKVTERATISQVINSRHSYFLTVNQETNTSKSPGWPPGQYFQSPKAKSCAVRAQPWVFVLLYAVSLLFPSLLMQYLFLACAIQPDLHVIWSCS